MVRVPPVFCVVIVCLISAVSLSGKDTWLFGQTEHFEISSNASERRTKYIIEELQLVRAVFQQLAPNLSSSKGQRLRVVICKDDKTMDMMVPLYDGKPKELGGMFHRDLEGGYILINLDGAYENFKTIVYHEYVHFLSNTRKTRLPAWLSEGIAEVFSTIEPTGRNRVVIGKPPPGNVMILREEKLLPLERLFLVGRGSSEYNSDDHGRGVFYAQSWALIHYLMFGSTDLPKGAYQQFVNLVLKDYYVSEETFSSIFGVQYDEMEKRIKSYIRSGKYYMTKPDRPEIEGTKDLDLRKGEPGEENMIIGKVRLATRGSGQSAGYLMNAYRQFPESSRAAAYMGYLDYRNGNMEEADKYLSEAVERGSESPSVFLWNAIAKMRTYDPRGNITARHLNKAQTYELLTLLFKARELGETRPELYRAIGRVWVNSSLTATDGNVRAVLEGAKLHREDAQIGLYMSMLVHRLGNKEEAQSLIDHYKSGRLKAEERKNFEWLEGFMNGE